MRHSASVGIPAMASGTSVANADTFLHESLRVFLYMTDTHRACCSAASDAFGNKVSKPTGLREVVHARAGRENPGTRLQQGIGIGSSSSSAAGRGFLR